MMKRRHSRRRLRDVGELNITAFMNLMVVLVPFLLITAVFSRLAVLELNLPTAQTQASDSEPPEFTLEITVRESGIEVGDRTAGTLSRIGKTGDDYDLDQLGEYLKRVKQRFPDKLDATLLLEPAISYQVLISVMDKVRVAEQLDTANRRVVKAELFPEISIGDAPLLN
jgi:biopolymer transport protein ExbD